MLTTTYIPHSWYFVHFDEMLNAHMQVFTTKHTSPLQSSHSSTSTGFPAHVDAQCGCANLRRHSQRKNIVKAQSLLAEVHRDRRRSDPVISYAADREPAARLPTQGESIVRGSGEDDQYGVQVMERSKPPAEIDYLAVSCNSMQSRSAYCRSVNVAKSLLKIQMCDHVALLNAGTHSHAAERP